MKRLTANFKFQLKNKFVKTTTRETKMRRKKLKKSIVYEVIQLRFLISRHFATIFRNVSTSPSIT